MLLTSGAYVWPKGALPGNIKRCVPRYDSPANCQLAASTSASRASVWYGLACTARNGCLDAVSTPGSGVVADLDQVLVRVAEVDAEDGAGGAGAFDRTLLDGVGQCAFGSNS